MTSRHRREHNGFNLGAVSPNGAHSTSGANPDGNAPRDEVRIGDAKAVAAGKIEVSPRAIAHLASSATQRSYGVVGLVPRHARPGWVELLRGEEGYRGVDVTFPDGRVLIELYVVIEYGTRISEVARNIMSGVKFAVESALGVPVVQVNVNVQDIRVSEQQKTKPEAS